LALPRFFVAIHVFIHFNDGRFFHQPAR